MTYLVILLAFFVLNSPASAEEIRVDTFDRHSNRTGYIVIDKQSGRIDSYDTQSNRQGFGYVSPRPERYVSPRPEKGVELYDRNDHRIPTERGRKSK